jgi:RNA polymerase sigma-70 factor (ECF subfamily)
VSTRSDFELLEAWRQGDREAGGVLFDRHLSAVTRFFKNKAEGNLEDLVQDTFLACVDGRDRFAGRSTFRTYLFAVARNILFDHYRARMRDFDPLLSTVAGQVTSPVSALASDDDQRLLLRALRELPADFQVTLELFYWEGMRGAELAEVLDISPHTVRSRLSRSRAALREAVQRLATAPRTSTATEADIEALARRLRARGGP